jgi:hypothetical protein
VSMVQAFVHPGGRRKRGNPNWGSGRPVRPVVIAATEFDRKLVELGLTIETCASSVKLRNWCAQNKDRCYVPESLLKAWRFAVDADLNGAA